MFVHGTATWTAENAAYVASDETFAQVQLGAYKAARQVIVSEELVTDSATAATGNATSFNYAALLSIYYGVPSQYRQNAAWIVSDGAARNLRGLVDTNGSPILGDANGPGEPQMLFGAPVYISADMPAPAAGARSVLFGDFSRAYIIRCVRGFAIQRQDELFSSNGQVGFHGFERVDGRVALTDAVRAGVHSAT